MVQEKTGYMEHPNDHDRVAEKILKLLQDDKLRKRMGAQARKKVQQEFNSTIIASKNLKFYKLVLER